MREDVDGINGYLDLVVSRMTVPVCSSVIISVSFSVVWSSGQRAIVCFLAFLTSLRFRSPPLHKIKTHSPAIYFAHNKDDYPTKKMEQGGLVVNAPLTSTSLSFRLTSDFNSPFKQIVA